MSKVVAEIKIIFDGQNVMMQGPIHDKILCLGILELAREIIVNDAKVKNKVELRPFTLDENGHSTPQ